MKPSIIFRIHRFIYFLLRGIGNHEEEHYLFMLEAPPLTDFELYTRLADAGWSPNYMGWIYAGQIYQCRRLLMAGKYQLHVRCYDRGKVTGHFEVSPEWDEQQHLKGVDLRTMNRHEVKRLKDDITGMTKLKRKFKVSERLD